MVNALISLKDHAEKNYKLLLTPHFNTTVFIWVIVSCGNYYVLLYHSLLVGHM